MIHTYISDLDAYLHFVKGNPYLIMLASVQGRQGAEIVEKIRENNPAASLIWLSDRDNALESWRIHVTAFGVFPTKRRIRRTSGGVQRKPAGSEEKVFCSSGKQTEIEKFAQNKWRKTA